MKMLTELFPGSLEFKLMRKVCVNILVIRRVAVQILMRVYLEYLKACVRYDDIKAEIFKRRYVAAQLGNNGEHLALATASVCVLDSYWPAVSVLHHKKQLAVIQMWHAMGKIKKSGYQSLGKKFGRSDMIAREMRMHRNYDVVIAGGRAFNPFYCASFDIDPDILYNVGLPRMDKLREGQEEARRQFYETYPQLKGKKIILYAPTFRKGQALDPKELVRAFRFDGSCVLIIKRHPNQLLVVDNLAPALTCPGMPTSTVLSVCDCVITDYSAITIEAALLGKPVYFYLFDYEDYLVHGSRYISTKFPFL